MKKKTLSLAVASILTVSLIGGATYAWFSDKAYGLDDGASGEISENSKVTAGFLDIELTGEGSINTIFSDPSGDGRFIKELTVENKSETEVVAKINVGNMLSKGQAATGLDLYTLLYKESSATSADPDSHTDNFFKIDKNDGELYVNHKLLASSGFGGNEYKIDAKGDWQKFYEQDATDLSGQFNLRLESITCTQDLYAIGDSIYVKLAANTSLPLTLTFELVDGAGDPVAMSMITNRFQYALYTLVEQAEYDTDGKLINEGALVYAKATQSNEVAVADVLGLDITETTYDIWTNGISQPSTGAIGALLFPVQP